MTIFRVKITPNASKNSIEGWQGDCLRIRLHAAPEKGEANRELIAFLAETLHVAKSDIEILSGHTARVKRVEIKSLSKLPEFPAC